MEYLCCVFAKLMTKTFSNLFKLMVTYLLKSHCPEGDPRLWNINGVGGKVFSYINDIRFPVFCVFAHQKLKGYEFHKNIHCYLIHRWSLTSKHFSIIIRCLKSTVTSKIFIQCLFVKFKQLLLHRLVKWKSLAFSIHRLLNEKVSSYTSKENFSFQLSILRVSDCSI